MERKRKEEKMHLGVKPNDRFEVMITLLEHSDWLRDLWGPEGN